MATYKELLAQKEKLEQQLAAAHAAELQTVIAVDLHRILTQDLHRKLTHPKGC